MRRIASLLMSLAVCGGLQAQTLDECQEAATRNYPLIKRMDLIRQTTDLTVQNIKKGWLPQVSAAAQASVQSDVTSFPEQIQAVYRQMGIDMKGLSRDQYRVGLDIEQAVFDGGAIKRQKEIARLQGELAEAQEDVNLYMVRERVHEMFFALLLLDEQILLKDDLRQLLEANERQLAAMFERGTAAESDYQNVKAERLHAAQQLLSMQSQRQTLARLLGVFCGLDVTTPVKPAVAEHSDANNRPELRLIDSRLRLTAAQERVIDAALMPRMGVFAQGFYGYPGYNLFDDMMHRQWSLNGMIGARLTWNIGALYTRKTDRARLQLTRQTAENDREVFLFNNRLEEIRQDEDIVRCRRMMEDDEEIIQLRAQVRKAAESKMQHGIIDVNDLMREITAENTARVQKSMHEIEMLKAIYAKKYTTNN